MLRIHARAEQVRERVEARAPENDVLGSVSGYLREMLEWQKNGFFGAYGVNKVVIFDKFLHGPDYRTAREAWEKFTQGRKDRRRLMLTPGQRRRCWTS